MYMNKCGIQRNWRRSIWEPKWTFIKAYVKCILQTKSTITRHQLDFFLLLVTQTSSSREWLLSDILIFEIHCGTVSILYTHILIYLHFFWYMKIPSYTISNASTFNLILNFLQETKRHTEKKRKEKYIVVHSLGSGRYVDDYSSKPSDELPRRDFC